MENLYCILVSQFNWMQSDRNIVYVSKYYIFVLENPRTLLP